ncbi:MAG: alpha/beta fold hydrolase [Arcicella sp.]|nr:alpha/beta fold hydrolase [Arcicella sp.]
MRLFKGFLILIAAVLSFQPVFSQATAKPVYVIVHGAWGGAWSFKKVDYLLTDAGNIVYRPNLTGQGERAHLATLDVGLDTHIKDVVNTILYEDLHDVILVGHSYGGMVVTGVADSIPDRIKKMIYLDAFVPEDNESLNDITNNNITRFEIKNGYVIPPWVRSGQMPPKDVPHPYKTLSDKSVLKNPLRLKLPTTYIHTIDKGKEAKEDEFYVQSERAKQKGWPIINLEADHNPQRSIPEELVKLLQKIAEN